MVTDIVKVVLFILRICTYGKVKVSESSIWTKLIDCKIKKLILNRDFGTNYPTEYLHDGWKLSPDFDFDTRINSYSGTRNF